MLERWGDGAKYKTVKSGNASELNFDSEDSAFTGFIYPSEVEPAQA